MSSPISAIKRRACVACTTAKAKCTPQSANLCQRCARLGKSCTYLDLPQTKRKQRQKAAPSRVELLEKKVDQLLSQLATLTQQQNGQTLSPDTSTNDSLPTNSNTNLPSSSHDSSSQGTPTDTDIAALLDAAKDPSHGPDPPTSSVLAGQPSLVDRGLLSPAEAERMLTVFKADFAAKFPFVLIPHGETADRLRVREPFLFLCVVAATMGSAHPLRKIVAEEIMNHVTSRIVARSERNLELLRGLLVHCAWYTYPAEKYHPRLLLLIQLCVAIVHDLGLHRRGRLGVDEQRALLGTYWLSVGFYGTLGRPITMKRDGQIDECIKSLASSTTITEYPSDRWIALFINLQSFMATMDEVYASMPPTGGSALVQITRGSLQRQFDSLRTSIEKDLPSCPPSTATALTTELKYTEMRLEDPSLREDLWTTDPATTIRTTMLMTLIRRSKELIQTVTDLPVSEIPQLTVITNARICAAVGYIPTAVLALLNLITSSSSTPNQDQNQIQSIITTADYPTLVTSLATALETKLQHEQGKRMLSATDKEMDVVGSLCSKMRLLARCYPYQVRAVVGNDATRRDNMSLSTATSMDHQLDVSRDDGEVVPQDWMPDDNNNSIYGDVEGIFNVDDIQWDALLRDFTTGFG
ncbi:uncharacterized protein BO88DRAFT_430921 [Aspergillus vadensis CBS 113365]|uniref:Zn(2)-C6 fungal-type domain-containing protein n=1 Tax=Aspergillus vadensis (strain CBS 113365 / IMI 142717 / IBT 24658) TaxID=1448311 RepID=A0A319BNZ1_ASPVC|nr:hypothetical protein BO88DRAFT_430921 [Aspergillus vadensis CBS 113365]PYH74337.1 hypothetical protein BO88DRAFT_430921 [Aspergillus vadensis CBS 113365]